MENTRIEIKKEITIATLERAIQKLQKELNKLKTIKDMEKQIREQQEIVDRLKKRSEPDKRYSHYGVDSPQQNTEPKDL